MTHYIVLTIGPVQRYISQARRTQDLWQGSGILSYLSRVGVEHVVESANEDRAIDLIYPMPPAPGDNSNIPNRMIVEYAGATSEQAEALAGEIKSRIESAWKDIATNTYAHIARQTGEPGDKFKQIWNRQVDDWLECYWVVVSHDANLNYAANIGTANMAMGARKMLRDFPHMEEHGRKCSVTGEHEALRDDDANYNVFWDALRAKQRNLALLSQHERLSAIATIKRFAHEKKKGEDGKSTPINEGLRLEERFPSTSSIAAMSFRYDVLHHLATLEDKLIAFLDALETVFRDAKDKLYFTRRERLPFIDKTFAAILKNKTVERFLSIDGDYLFEDTYITTTIAEYAGFIKNGKPDPSMVDKGHMKKAQEALHALCKAAAAKGIKPPNPYLVILSMDGDNMGKTLRYIPNKYAHKHFSKTIAEFARDDVVRIVEVESLGRVVYAGGDDVLAVLPVRDALEVAQKLQAAFRNKVRAARIPCEQSDYSYDAADDSGNPASFVKASASAGLAYVHHTHNLQNAIDAANNTQKSIAKKRAGRDAIAIRLLRRSGEPREMAHKWITTEGELIVDRVMGITQHFADDILSRNLPQDIQSIIYSMTDCDDIDDVLAAARQAELERIIRRRLNAELVNDVKETAKQIVTEISVLAKSQGERQQSTQTRWTNALHWIELARFISQAGLAEGGSS